MLSLKGYREKERERERTSFPLNSLSICMLSVTVNVLKLPKIILQSTTIEWKLVYHTKVVSKGRSSVSIEAEVLYSKYVCHLVNYKSLQVRDMHFHLMVIDCRN